MLTFLLHIAVGIRISGKTGQTVAIGQMIAHMTFGITATGAGAGIFAFAIKAGQLCGTVRIDDTFRATAFIGITLEFWQTLAGSYAITFKAFGIGAAGTGLTGTKHFPYGLISKRTAKTKRISSMANGTIAHWRMIDDATFCIGAAHSRTGILTFLIDAGLRAGAF